MVNIITDSTSDLGVEIIAEFGLVVVPLLITIGGHVYRDGLDIGQEELFSLVEKYGELPKTAAPSVGEFTQAFDRSGDSVFVGISSKLSATIQNAQLAAKLLPVGKVRVIDSLNLSSGVGSRFKDHCSTDHAPQQWETTAIAGRYHGCLRR